MSNGMRLLSIILAGGLAAGAMAQDSKKPAPAKKAPPSNEEMMAEMMKYAKPGEGHERLKPLAGAWKTSVKSWDAPGTEPSQTSEGECTTQWIMEGRYLKEECTGTFAQMPFQGMGLYGYDNMKKIYVSTWVDNLGTGIMNSTGSADKAGKTITYHATMPDPTSTSGKMMKVRMTNQIVDNNSHVFSMYVPAGPKGEFKMMEITYTRK